MYDLNVVTLSGYLIEDPVSREVKTSQGESTVTTFRMASNRGVGENVKTVYVDVECWRGLAEVMRDYTAKGDKVVVSGLLRQDNWKDKDTGGNRSKLIIIANDVVLPRKSS